MADAPKMDAELREIFKVAYAFRQKYQFPTGSEQFWRNCADEMQQLVIELHEHPFAVAVFFACYEDIERELKEHPPTIMEQTQLFHGGHQR